MSDREKEKEERKSGKILRTDESAQRIYRCSLSYSFSFSIDLKIFDIKIEGKKATGNIYGTCSWYQWFILAKLL